MEKMSLIEINTDEVFEVLPKAPIVEAVIDIRARAMKSFEETPARTHLEMELNDYLFLDSQRTIKHEVKLQQGKPPSQMVEDLGWKGLRFRSSDEKHIAQFNRDGFVFSRMEPYVDWSRFTNEGLKLWEVFRGLAQPVAIQRIGLRFINRIVLPVGELKFEDYIQPAPSTPRELDLPFLGYMHQDILAVPGYPYAIKIVQTIQPPPPAGTTQGVALILDIDVFTIQGFELEEAELALQLEKMRWLKDKVFFGSITEKAKEIFR